MKQKTLIILIILFSTISGAVGSFFMIKLLPDIKNKEILDKIEENSKNLESLKQNQPQNTTLENTNNLNINSLENNITSLIKQISPSVVSIIIKKDLIIYKTDPWGFFKEPVGKMEKKIGGGTGFFITKNGLIITNKHVIIDTNDEYTVITNDKKEFNAKVISIDPITDLAILKIEGYESKPLTFIDDEKNINIGQFAIAIGNALGEFQNSVSLGVVSGKNRNIKDFDINLSNLIQTDAAINPGNSGGPLINLKGEVMGINTAIVNGSQGIGFSIGLNTKKIDYILNSIQKFGKIKRPFIGINYVLISDGIKEQLGAKINYGAYILKEDGAILKGSSAEKAGLEQGDIITEAEGIKVSIENDLNSIIQDKIPGDKIKLIILKSNGENKEIYLTLGEI